MSAQEAAQERAKETAKGTAQEAGEEHVVGAAADFPVGQHKIVTVNNIEIGIFNVDGTLHALPNVCPHQYGPLSKGPVGGMMSCNASTNWKFHWGRSGEILTCPWHGLEFDIKTGQCLAPKKFSVRSFPVNVVEGKVRVSLSRKRVEAAE
jgi:nitrite reductase/ring-hydroxylating ferredoxin subunit